MSTWQGGWLGCSLTGEGGRGILGAVCSLKAPKVGVPRERRGWKAPASGWQVLSLPRAADIWSR